VLLSFMAAINHPKLSDDPSILQEWKELHRHYTEELGFSNRRSYTFIGQKYGYSRSGVQYWIEENVRCRSIQRKKETLIPYSNHPRVEERRRHSRVYQHIRRRPDIYLKKAYSGHDAPLTLDQLTSHLFELTGISIGNTTLLKILSRYEQNHGQTLLIPVKNHLPPSYCLGSELGSYSRLALPRSYKAIDFKELEE
jgi:hypothetical protein